MRFKREVRTFRRAIDWRDVDKHEISRNRPIVQRVRGFHHDPHGRLHILLPLRYGRPFAIVDTHKEHCAYAQLHSLLQKDGTPTHRTCPCSGVSPAQVPGASAHT